jgi:predicted protein tyrosine phosphatase
MSNGSRERILFVCTANRDRSRTAEDLYAEDPRYEVASAGTWRHATTPLSRDLLLWADRIFVMCEREDGHRSQIEARFPDVRCPIVDLDIADRSDWLRDHPELRRCLLERLEPHLGRPEGVQVEGPPAGTDARAGSGTWDLRGVPRLLAVGDVQSNFSPLASLLESAGYLAWEDERPIWCAGRGVLLFLGDLLDGGTEPAEVLSLVAALAPQARTEGGRVALLRGNHELMLLESLRDGDPLQVGQWFANGGLETLVRLSVARGRTVSDSLRAAIFTPIFGATSAEDPEIRDLIAFVRAEYAPELSLLEAESRAAALVNGCALAVHGSPNFSAPDWSSFSLTERDDLAMAWGREWVRGWPEEHACVAIGERLRGLKARLDSEPEGISVRHVLFAHTELDALAVPGFQGRQHRVGRVADAAADLPAAYSLMTVPRAIARGGALGGLELSASGGVAIYSCEIRDGERTWPAREVLAPPDPAFVHGLKSLA